MVHSYKAWLAQSAHGYRPSHEVDSWFVPAAIDLQELPKRHPVEILTAPMTGFLPSGVACDLVKVRVRLNALLLADVWVQASDVARA